MRPVSAEDVQAEAPEFIWGDRIARGEMHFLAGRPDVGKGLMAAKIAADVSMGRDPITGKQVQKPGRVLYSAKEDSYGMMTRPRLEAAGARLEGGAIKLWRFGLPSMFAELADWITEFQIDLVIIDPLAAHLDSGVSRFSDNIRRVTEPLFELLQVTRAACLVVDHVNKRVSPHAEALTAVGGSGSGFAAACRMGFLYGRDPGDEDRRVLANVKSNICEKRQAMVFELDTVEQEINGELESVPVLHFDCEDSIEAIKLVASDKRTTGKVGRPADKAAQACEWLTTYLFMAWSKRQAGDASAYPVLGKVVFEDAQQAGLHERTLRRAADQMHIKKSGRGGTKVTWSLPDEVLDMLTGVADEKPPEVADKPVEEPELKRMLDTGQTPSGDPSEWERNKPEEAPATSAEFDAEFSDFLSGLEAEEGGEANGTA